MRKTVVAIEPMTDSDDAAVSRIVSKCYRLIAQPDHITAQPLDRLIRERCQPAHMAAMRERYLCLVAKAADDPVGVIAVNGARIEEMFVSPEYHRRGIGEELFRAVERIAAATGETTLRVETTGYGIPFYEAMGMRIVGRERVAFGPLKGRENVLLEKDLTDHDA